MSGPFQDGTKQQGPQSPVTPAQHYRKALAALDAPAAQNSPAKRFAELADDQKDEVIKGLEDGSLKLERDRRSGFLQAHPEGHAERLPRRPDLWRQQGHGVLEDDRLSRARYDYRDWIERHNQRFPLPPVGIADHPDWTQ